MISSKRIIRFGVVILVAWTIITVYGIITPAAPIDAPFNHFLKTQSAITEVLLKSDGRTIVYIIDGVKFQSVSPANTSLIVTELLNTDVIINAEAPETPSSMGTMVILSLIPVLVLVAFLYWIGKKQNGQLAKFSKSKHIMQDPKNNKIKMSDVAGNLEDYEDIIEIIDFLKNPTQYTDTGAKIPKGVLLSGPSGVGKTLISKAIAGEAKVPFFTISGSDFVEMYVGTGAARVRDLFADAKKNAPCIIFIDEIDAVGENRNADAGSGGSSERKQTLNQLLVEMDGFDTDSSVIVIAATNRPEVLDPALIRPGRFDRNISINLPDIDAREKILLVHLANIKLDGVINVRDIAKGTTGCSGAELASIVNESALLAAKNKKTIVSMQDLENAKDKVLMGAKSSAKMSKEEIELTAWHEAGHAIIGYCSPEHDPVYKVSIIPRGRALGVTMFIPEQDNYSLSLTKIHSKIKTLFGGRIAEEMLRGKKGVTTGASSDIERATLLARKTVMDWGLSKLGIMHYSKTRGYAGQSNDFSEETCQTIDKEIQDILDKNYNAAVALLKKHKNELKIMAELLIQKETIDSTDIKNIMDGSGVVLSAGAY